MIQDLFLGLVYSGLTFFGIMFIIVLVGQGLKKLCFYKDIK